MKRGRSKTEALRILRERFKRGQKNRHIPKGAKFLYGVRGGHSLRMPLVVFLMADAHGKLFPGAYGDVPFTPRGYKPPPRERTTRATPAAIPPPVVEDHSGDPTTADGHGSDMRTDRDDTRQSPLRQTGPTATDPAID